MNSFDVFVIKGFTAARTKDVYEKSTAVSRTIKELDRLSKDIKKVNLVPENQWNV